MGPICGSQRNPYADPGVPYGSLTDPVLPSMRDGKGAPEMLDLLMVALTIVTFGVLVAMVAWLERV
jgi:hypothetical protein